MTWNLKNRMSAWLEREMCDNRTKDVIVNIILLLLLLLLLILFYYYSFIYDWQNNTQIITKCTQLIIVLHQGNI